MVAAFGCLLLDICFVLSSLQNYLFIDLDIYITDSQPFQLLFKLLATNIRKEWVVAAFGCLLLDICFVLSSLQNYLFVALFCVFLTFTGKSEYSSLLYSLLSVSVHVV